MKHSAEVKLGQKDGYRLGWKHGYEAGVEAFKLKETEGNYKAKIGYVIPGCAISGGIAVVCQHTNRLKDRGYDVIMITEDDQREISWYPNQVPIVPVNEAPTHMDIIVATLWSTVSTARKLKAGRRYYFVQSDETRFYPPNSENYRLALETYRSNDFIFLTMAQWLKKWLYEHFDQSAIYVPNGLDESLIYRTDPLVLKGNKLRVLLEGAINNPLKGMEEAFQAVQNLDCEVWCVSSQGSPKPEWRCDRFFEQVAYDQMRTIYSSCDILLKMSKVESFLYPPLEMMACGGVSVVAEVTGTDEYLRHGINAILVPQDVGAAAEAVSELLRNERLRQRLIDGGQETMRNWDWNRSIDVLEGVFAR